MKLLRAPMHVMRGWNFRNYRGSKELPIRWGANTSTKVLPPQIRRGIRGSPEVQLFRQLRSCSIKIRARSSQRQLESKFRRIMKLTRTTTLPTGVCRVYLHFASRNYCPCIRSVARARNPRHSGMRRTDGARKSGRRLAISGVPDLPHFILTRDNRDNGFMIVYDLIPHFFSLLCNP